MLLCCFLNSCKAEVTGISFVDSTPIEVSHPCRSRSDRVFKDIAGWGKNSLGWHAASEACKRRRRDLGAYALRFKLHLIINDKGELLAFKLTPGNVDDRKPVPEMSEGIFGKLFGARGYISQDLFEQLYEQQLKLITRYKKNMKQKLLKLIDKILLRQRALIETVNDQLKNIFQQVD